QRAPAQRRPRGAPAHRVRRALLGWWIEPPRTLRPRRGWSSPSMAETSLELVVAEHEFLPVLRTHSEVFFRLANMLLDPSGRAWTKKHYFQLINESEALESFLDDYGARYNRAYGFFTELVASVRWFALAGYSISHMQSRVEGYGLAQVLGPRPFQEVLR